MAELTAATPDAPRATLRTPRFIQLHRPDSLAVQREILAGLGAPAPFLSPKFLYDTLGSRLFDAITELTEYYPTRTEAAIFQSNRADIARHLPTDATLVDLGAGDCAKAARLFASLKPKRYVAVDISAAHLQGALGRLQQQHPDLDMLGVGADFSTALALPDEASAPLPDGRHPPMVVFYPGSSIGNFEPADALRFLQQAHAVCAGASKGRATGGLLIGVDLVKNVAVLEAAYDDALGVTAAFNRNLLLHCNRLADTDFRVADWAHVAFYNVAASRIEMHLQARTAVTVHWPGGRRAFAAGERIHTENSCKWRASTFDAMLQSAGFSQTRCWTDPQGWFALFWAQV